MLEGLPRQFVDVSGQDVRLLRQDEDRRLGRQVPRPGDLLPHGIGHERFVEAGRQGLSRHLVKLSHACDRFATIVQPVGRVLNARKS